MQVFRFILVNWVLILKFLFVWQSFKINLNYKYFFCFVIGLSKFARLAKSVTRNKSLLANFNSGANTNIKNTKLDASKTSQFFHVIL